jgi:hypothetical protein
MLYIGYPISAITAMYFYKLSPETSSIDELMDHVNSSGFVLEYVDKGQYVFGLPVPTFRDGNYVDVDDMLMNIIKVKKAFVQQIKNAVIDISEFMIQPIGEESTETVYNPEPYFIEV